MINTIVSIIVAFIFSCFSSAVIAYIALTTQIGPWVGPTLALLATLVYKPFAKMHKELFFPVIAGALGGIIATAVTFSFPTLYFLNKTEFNGLFAFPLKFVGLLFIVILVTGLIAQSFVMQWKNKLLQDTSLSFPVGQLVYSIISAQEKAQQTKQLLIGVVSTIAYSTIQAFSGIKNIALWSKMHCGALALPAVSIEMAIFPLYLAIGYAAGAMIAIPLFVGTILKIFIADPVYYCFFSSLQNADYMLAFGGGIVLSGALLSLVELPFSWYKVFHNYWKKRHLNYIKESVDNQDLKTSDNYDYKKVGYLVLACLAAYFTLTYSLLFDFSWISAIYLIGTSIISMYVIVTIAGKIGLALLGRFATYVLMPGLLLFGYNPLQITIVAMFVELCGGIATELMFGYKTAQLADIDSKKVAYYQLFGIVISAIAVPCVLYILVSHFELGSEQLCAQRGLARALLVQSASFDYYVLGIGCLVGLILKKIKVNPMFVLSGFLMPLSLSLQLIAGGCISLFMAKKDTYETFVSGVYATNAVTVLLRLFL